MSQQGSGLENAQAIFKFVADHEGEKQTRDHPTLLFGASGGTPDIPTNKRHQSDLSITSYVEDYGLGLRAACSPELGSPSVSISEIGSRFDSPIKSQPQSILEKLPKKVEKGPDQSYTQYMEGLLWAATLRTKKSEKGGRWIPINKIEEICQRSLVVDVLKETFQEKKDEINKKVGYVCGPDNLNSVEKGNRRIFVTLVLANGVKNLTEFIRADMRDADLPLEWTSDEEVQLKTTSPNLDKVLSCAKRNDAIDTWMGKFHEFQWRTVIPFIAQDKDNKEAKEYQLHPETVMPWTSVGPRNPGGYSNVRKVEIHPAHHSFGEGQVFALKTLIEQDPIKSEANFESELRVFRKMKPEKHLVELYATFKFDEFGSPEYSFLFPWASGGSLYELWRKTPPKILEETAVSSKDFLKWIAEQCSGLVSGLRKIHNLRKQQAKELENESGDDDADHYGIHGDIKPHNILHFMSPNADGLGTLKLADFGLTIFHKRTSRTQEDGDQRIPPNPTYVPPERRKPDLVSRKLDIWALGCVFSQFITWAVLGNERLKNFDAERKDERLYGRQNMKGNHKTDNFFVRKQGPDGVEVISLKDATKKYLKELMEISRDGHDENSKFLADFVDLIGERMLQIQRDKRIDCEELASKLESLLERGSDSGLGDNYWNTRLPSLSFPSPPQIQVNNISLTDRGP